MTEPASEQISRPPRPRGRASDSAATRRTIVDAAARLFSERGYAAASLSDIVACTGTTKGAVYWHFKSKEDMAVAIVEQMYERWPAMLDAVASDHDDALSTLVAVTYTAAEQFATDPIAQAGKRLLTELPDAVLTHLPTPYIGWEKALAGLLENGQRAGQINRDIEPASAAQVIVASFFGIQQVSYELTARKDLRARLDAFWRLVLPQLRPK